MMYIKSEWNYIDCCNSIFLKLFLLFIFFIGNTDVAYSQTQEELIIKNINLALNNKNNKQFTKALEFSETAYHLSKKIESLELKFDANRCFVLRLIDLNKFDKAYKTLLELDSSILKDKGREYLYNSTMGTLFYKMGAPVQALKFKLKCISYESNFYVLGDIGNIYLKLNNVDSSIFYYKYQVSEAKKLNDSLLIVSGNNNIGFAYSVLNNIDSSIFYYKKALSLYNSMSFNSNKNIHLYATVNGNIGEAYMLGGDYPKAIKYLTVDYDYNIKNKLYNKAIIVGDLLCESYYKIGKEEPIRIILETLIPFKSKLVNSDFIKLAKIQLEYYDLMHNSFKLKDLIKIYNDSNAAYIKKLEFEKFEIASVISDYRLQKNNLELLLEKNKFETQYKIVKQKKQKMLLIFTLISFSSLLLILVFFIWNTNNKKQSKIDELILKSEKNKLSKDVEYKKTDLADLSINIKRNKTFNEKVVMLIDEIKTASTEELNQRILNLSNFVNQQQNSNNTIELFQGNIDTISNEFFNKLSSLHKDLTKNEEEICGLIRLNMSNKDIATIKIISVQSARTARYRIKKKLNISKEMTIQEYLQSL